MRYLSLHVFSFPLCCLPNKLIKHRAKKDLAHKKGQDISYHSLYKIQNFTELCLVSLSDYLKGTFPHTKGNYENCQFFFT